MKRSSNRLILRGAIMGLLLVIVNGCLHDPFIDPSALNEGKPTTPGCTSGGDVCFESTILPIFTSSCARSRCHDAVAHEENYVLDSYSNIVRKGIKPGNAADSKIYEVLFESGEDGMPPGESLSQAQKDSIKLWIDQGARNTVDCNCYCDPLKFSYTLNIEPIIVTACVGCHKPGFLGGDINLEGYANVKIQVDNGYLIGTLTHAIGFIPMPQGSKLSECEIEKVQNWINDGAPKN